MPPMAVPLNIQISLLQKFEGALPILEEFDITFDTGITYWITYSSHSISSQWSFRLPFLLQILLRFFIGLGIIFLLLYSRRWLASVGSVEKCVITLSRVRRLPTAHYQVQCEWRQNRAEVACHKEISRERHSKLHTYYRKLSETYETENCKLD